MSFSPIQLNHSLACSIDVADCLLADEQVIVDFRAFSNHTNYAASRAATRSAWVLHECSLKLTDRGERTDAEGY